MPRAARSSTSRHCQRCPTRFISFEWRSGRAARVSRFGSTVSRVSPVYDTPAFPVDGHCAWSIRHVDPAAEFVVNCQQCRETFQPKGGREARICAGSAADARDVTIGCDRERRSRKARRHRFRHRHACLRRNRHRPVRRVVPRKQLLSREELRRPPLLVCRCTGLAVCAAVPPRFVSLSPHPPARGQFTGTILSVSALFANPHRRTRRGGLAAALRASCPYMAPLRHAR